MITMKDENEGELGGASPLIYKFPALQGVDQGWVVVIKQASSLFTRLKYIF
jgi:hypothetical protein